MNHPFGLPKSLSFFNPRLIRWQVIVGKLNAASRRRFFTQIILLSQHLYVKIPFVNERLKEERSL